MYKILKTNQSEEWNNYLNKVPIRQRDIYYTPEYYLLHEIYGDGEALCFIFENEIGLAIYPFLKKQC